MIFTAVSFEAGKRAGTAVDCGCRQSGMFGLVKVYTTPASTPQDASRHIANNFAGAFDGGGTHLGEGHRYWAHAPQWDDELEVASGTVVPGNTAGSPARCD
jgi:hypothetical protein